MLREEDALINWLTRPRYRPRGCGPFLRLRFGRATDRFRRRETPEIRRNPGAGPSLFVIRPPETIYLEASLQGITRPVWDTVILRAFSLPKKTFGVAFSSCSVSASFTC